MYIPKKIRLLFAAAAVSSLLFFPKNKLSEKERERLWSYWSYRLKQGELGEFRTGPLRKGGGGVGVEKEKPIQFVFSVSYFFFVL